MGEVSPAMRSEIHYYGSAGPHLMSSAKVTEQGCAPVILSVNAEAPDFSREGLIRGVLYILESIMANPLPVAPTDTEEAQHG